MASRPRPALAAPAPLIDQRLVAGFLIGPLAGAAVYAAFLHLARPGPQDFWFYLINSLAYGYGTSLVVLLPAFLLLRHFKVDQWGACAAIGLITGFLFYWLVFHVPASAGTLRTLIVNGALPFLFIACAIRLIAGKRA
jgi:hypothetical protein